MEAVKRLNADIGIPLSLRELGIVEKELRPMAEATAQIIRERFPSVDAGAWLDRHPYQRREIVERWKGDLASVGATAAD